MFPRWLGWLFIAVIAYLIYLATQNTPQLAADKPNPIPAITEQTYPALAKATNVEKWKRALDPDYAAKYQCLAPAGGEGLGLKIIDETMGEGDKANCSEPISVQLTVWGSNGKKAYEGELNMVIGTRAIAAGLDVGVVGMRVGGSRTLVIPPTLMDRAKDAPKPATALLHALPKGKLAVVTVKRIE
jgi:hypothetical protein